MIEDWLVTVTDVVTVPELATTEGSIATVHAYEFGAGVGVGVDVGVGAGVGVAVGVGVGVGVGSGVGVGPDPVPTTKVRVADGYAFAAQLAWLNAVAPSAWVPSALDTKVWPKLRVSPGLMPAPERSA